jgi:hypothetical protein
MVYPIAMIVAITLVVAVLMMCQEETSVGLPDAPAVALEADFGTRMV